MSFKQQFEEALNSNKQAVSLVPIISHRSEVSKEASVSLTKWAEELKNTIAENFKASKGLAFLGPYRASRHNSINDFSVKLEGKTLLRVAIGVNEKSGYSIRTNKNMPKEKQYFNTEETSQILDALTTPVIETLVKFGGVRKKSIKMNSINLSHHAETLSKLSGP